MSPMTLHTCLQGPLSEEKPNRSETTGLVTSSSRRAWEPGNPNSGPFHEVPW